MRIRYLRVPAMLASLCCLLLATPSTSGAQAAPRRALFLASDISDVVRLETLEDRRDFDATELQRLAASKHPEVRRRTALALGRLFDMRGRGVLRSMRSDADTAVLATVVWATGVLLDTSSVPWLDSLMQSAKAPVGASVEAAGALGKIRTSDTRMRLGLFLGSVAAGARSTPVVAEALLSIGRHADRGDIKPIVRWAESPDVELRWRAAWALFRPRDPAAVPDLLTLAKDASPEVRFWAVRGLTGSRVDSSDVGAAAARAALWSALEDPDRRVRTEAVRALGTHNDARVLIQLSVFLDAEDPWVAVSAAEALGAMGDRARPVLAQLSAATTDAESPSWVRASALDALTTVWLAAALEPATALANDTSVTVRQAAARSLAKLGVGGASALATLTKDKDRTIRATALRGLTALVDTLEDVGARREALKGAFASTDAMQRAAAVAAMSRWADTVDVPVLLDAFARAAKDTVDDASSAAIGALGALQRRAGVGAKEFFARFPTSPSGAAWMEAARAFGTRAVDAWGSGRPIATGRSEADYRRIVETLVVPAYNGAARPRVRWETSRGAVDTELNTLDAPLASDLLLGYAAKGTLGAVRFERVVPNFVAQQGSVLPNGPTQRDEISRGRLVRGNLSWATGIGAARRPGAAFDTGPAAYTFGNTPQPHNEGDFSALGRVIRGMEVIDKMELGDVVRSARVLKPGEK